MFGDEPLPRPNPYLCERCHQRPGKVLWVGEGGALAYVHGGGSWWCHRCVLTAQIDFAKKLAEQIGPLEAALAALED
jgi:hypothetical protein